MIIWGGYNNVSNPTNTGGRFNPLTDSWIATSIANAPEARAGSATIWTGTEMVVWGGSGYTESDVHEFLGTGGRYNPSSDSWTATTNTNAPSPRGANTAVWTGTQMIIWGGFYMYGNDSNTIQTFFNDGGIYVP
jgi:N-acetylneuraminic acid mutarotase